MSVAATVDQNRIQIIKEDVCRRGGSFVPDQNPYVRDVKQGGSRVQVRAALLREVVELCPLLIPPGWTLAGEHLIVGQGAGFGLMARETPDLRRIHDLGASEADLPGVRQAVAGWTGQVPGSGICQAVGKPGEGTPAGMCHWGDWNPGVYSASGWSENHSIRDFAKVLRIGFAGIRDEVEQQMRQADIADPAYPARENFWQAALSVCDAGIRLGARYADLARSLAESADDPRQQDRFAHMAATCARVPAEGARTFFEAVQALWFAHILTCGEDGINANSIGRLDQILFPYYTADIAAGRLTREAALEIMVEFACKLYLDYDVQAIVLGGVDRAGRSAVNELSYLILDATEQAELIRDLSIRLDRDTPEPFVRQAARLICRGGGIPFIFNDECFIPALSEHGVALEDARDYAPIGCIELTIPGRASPHAVSGWFNSAKCLELALFNGLDPRRGVQVGPRSGEFAEFATFEDFYAAYCAQVEFFARRMVYHCNRGELAQRERGPLPCQSVMTDDCIARGRDITDGGAIYNYHSICFMGTANTADSLMALRKLVFEQRSVERGALLEALRKDFAGAEDLRQQLLHQAPKYGNDQPEVDALAHRVSSHFIDLMDRMRSPLDGRYVVHLFSFRLNIEYGQAVGATPDGRNAGEPLAYSLSAHQGRDQKGISAMLNSLARLPHARAAGATAAIIDLDPAVVKGVAGEKRLTRTIQAAIRMGVGQLQWNVVTVERLRQAQRDPERYGNIPVRVAGYSQKFRLLTGELQEHIIARTKHSG